LRKGPASWNQQQLYIHSSLTLTYTRQVNFMLCNHVTKLGRFISASGFCTQLMMVKVILIWLLFWRSGVSFAQTFRQKIIGTGVPLIHKVKFNIQHLNSGVHVYRDITFSTSYNIGKLTLFLLSNACIVSGKSFSPWWRFMHLLSAANMWQLNFN
jgi:hypothetical protein